MRKLQYLGLAAILAGLPTLAIGCGDDDEPEGNPGTGGAAGSAGSAGNAGTGGGAAGTGGTGGTGGGDAGGDSCPATPTAAPTLLEGTISASRTLTADKVWELAAPGTFVTNGATLTIEPCTTIVGGAQTALVITRGAKIEAVGTANRPIVFTSKNAKGSRNPGDWGGLVILGRAPINQEGGTAAIEGLSPTDDRGTYGGTDAADNSGRLKYVRVEFNGFVYGKDNELNGVTFGAVGSGTEVDHVMVNRSADDGFEWFGGTVNASYLVVNDSKGDDLFDADFGYSGKVTHFFGRKSGFGGDDKDPNGFEWDNTSGGEALQPFTNPTFEKGTLCGRDLSAAPSNSYGAVLRRRTKGTITETVFNGWKSAFDVRNSKEASEPTAPTITASTVFGGALDNPASTTSDADETAWFNGGTGNVTTDPGFSADDCFAAPGSTEFGRVTASNKGAFTGNASWLAGAWLDWSEN